MAWKKGQSGNPLGRQSEKPWRDALLLALGARDRGALREIADTVVRRAIDGDMIAVKEIGDRLDGRAKQQTELTGDNNNPLRFIIERIDAPGTPNV